jgi:hypothetical protein
MFFHNCKEVAYATLPQYEGRWRKPQIFAQVAQVERRTQSSFDAPGMARAVRGAATCWVSFMVKLLRAYGGCLGANRRRRTWQAAISLGEPQAGFDPRISEWGNPY